MCSQWRCAGIASFSLCAVTVVWGARPLVVDDADPVGLNNLQVEAGFSYRRMDACDHWDFPVGVAYGIHERLELNVGMGGILDEGLEVMQDGTGRKRDKKTHGLGDLTTGAKWLVVEECPLNFRHTFAPEIKFPTANHKRELGSGETDYDLMWIASRDLGECFGLHLNGGYTFAGGDVDVLHYGVALDYQLSESIQLVGEVYNEHEADSFGEPLLQFTSGVRWEVVAGVSIDFAAGTKIYGDAPDFTATAGVTCLF